MTLPDEIWVDILDYLEPQDIISSQRVSSRLLPLARDNKLWKAKCFERAPSAAVANANAPRPDALVDLTGALGGSSLSETPPQLQSHTPTPRLRASKRTQAITRWDQTTPDEQIDWYSEYTARHATLDAVWCPSPHEIRGVALHATQQKVVGCLEDGSVSIWDIKERPFGRRRFHQIAHSSPGILFTDQTATGEPSAKKSATSFSGVVDCISMDSTKQKAYVAVDQILNEVDLDTLQVVSQSHYAWPITALSPQGQHHLPLSVGTSWSLHLYDPRVSFRDRSRSPEDLMRVAPGEPEDSIAFLPNYAKGRSRIAEPNPLPASAPPTRFSQILGHTGRPTRRARHSLRDYAHMEPGPQSILHHDEHEILIAGRFPSILSYDRRYFPRLQYVIHSGARLSALTSIPSPPKAARGTTSATSTLIACGEYNGRGSLELYSMPNAPQWPQSSEDFGLGHTSEPGAADRELALLSSEQDYPYSYKNRQEASSSKLLSVAVTGTRIVFSDAEGAIKWVERDGRGLARRWNINSWQLNTTGGGLNGELVAQKILPIDVADSIRGTRCDGDLLVFTGDKAGIVTTRPQYEEHDELVKAIEDETDLSEKEEQEKAEEYSKTMRRAFERQADERRWMSQFRLKRGLF